MNDGTNFYPIDLWSLSLCKFRKYISTNDFQTSSFNRFHYYGFFAIMIKDSEGTLVETTMRDDSHRQNKGTIN